MPNHTFRDGRVPFNIPSRNLECHTYYKIYGDLDGGVTPVIVLHGGPGSGHEYVEPFSDLWTTYGIPVVLYDQVGCAKSTHLPETRGDQSFWQPSLFVAELDNLIEHLNLNRHGDLGYHVLGHSWGGSLAVDFAARQPTGLRRLILAGANASFHLFKKGYWKLLKALPSEHLHAVEDAIAKNDYSTIAYNEAMSAMMHTYLCRGRPFPPPELALDFANHAADDTVRRTLIGDSAFVLNGSLESWDATPRLSNINVPTFVFNGEFDTAQDDSTAPFFEHIPKVRWLTLPGASHMSHLDSKELREKTMHLFASFLLPTEDM